MYTGWFKRHREGQQERSHQQVEDFEQKEQKVEMERSAERVRREEEEERKRVQQKREEEERKRAQQEREEKERKLAQQVQQELLLKIEDLGKASKADSLAEMKEKNRHEINMRILQIYETTIQNVKSADVIGQAAYGAFVLQQTLHEGSTVNEQVLQTVSSKVPNALPANINQVVEKVIDRYNETGIDFVDDDDGLTRTSVDVLEMDNRTVPAENIDN